MLNNPLDILKNVSSIAIVGISSKEERDSYKVMKFLIEKGYKVFPVNPNEQGKYILGRKQIDIALKTLDQERRALLKARDQGGVIAVEADGVLITAYRFDSFNRKLAQL